MRWITNYICKKEEEEPEDGYHRKHSYMGSSQATDGVHILGLLPYKAISPAKQHGLGSLRAHPAATANTSSLRAVLGIHPGVPLISNSLA